MSNLIADEWQWQNSENTHRFFYDSQSMGHGFHHEIAYKLYIYIRVNYNDLTATSLES